MGWDLVFGSFVVGLHWYAYAGVFWVDTLLLLVELADMEIWFGLVWLGLAWLVADYI